MLHQLFSQSWTITTATGLWTQVRRHHAVVSQLGEVCLPSQVRGDKPSRVSLTASLSTATLSCPSEAGMRDQSNSDAVPKICLVTLFRIFGDLSQSGSLFRPSGRISPASMASSPPPPPPSPVSRARYPFLAGGLAAARERGVTLGYRANTGRLHRDLWPAAFDHDLTLSPLMGFQFGLGSSKLGLSGGSVGRMVSPLISSVWGGRSYRSGPSPFGDRFQYIPSPSNGELPKDRGVPPESRQTISLIDCRAGPAANHRPPFISVVFASAPVNRSHLRSPYLLLQQMSAAANNRFVKESLHLSVGLHVDR
ncbi:hypothetical protein RRG08_049514 [Elysia crispata]|uniref:Uncharacterized protein n=1 Tax=Elysia crispata TaxID=231223 RepID=A0AAE0ZEQ7_9GAST|nr:hypothetical protein RRG08_049514 [Elysia crispata]